MEVIKQKNLIISSLLTTLFLLLISTPGIAGLLSDAFVDPSDGYLDMSNWILDKEGILPVPVIITEPAVGYGGGLAGVYFHDKLGARKGSPPSVSALVGAATENGTWFVGGGHLGIWANDNVRYTGGLGTGLVKMDYYGLVDELGKNEGVQFETKVMSFNDAWGGDQNFEKYSALLTYYTPFYKNFVLGLRGNAKAVEGEAPFYSYPYIDCEA